MTRFWVTIKIFTLSLTAIAERPNGGQFVMRMRKEDEDLSPLVA